MTIDINAMLHRVVDIDRTARIRASYEWTDAFIPELEVGTILFDYDDVEEEKEVELRRLCLVIRAYLEGEGHIEKRRRIFGLGTTSILRIEVDGFRWDLGRSWSSGPYPA